MMLIRCVNCKYCMVEDSLLMYIPVHYFCTATKKRKEIPHVYLMGAKCKCFAPKTVLKEKKEKEKFVYPEWVEDL